MSAYIGFKYACEQGLSVSQLKEFTVSSSQQINAPEPESENASSERGTGLINIAKSTIAAACGIQTNANRERDFQQGKASSFVIAGLVFVTVFVLLMVGIVQLVLHLAS